MEKKIIDIGKRTYKFVLDVIKLTEEFPKTTASYVIQKQLIRSVTSIGANLVEASYAASRKDFTNFNRYALKSAHETVYWLTLSKDLKLASVKKIEKLIAEGIEIRKIIATIVIKTKS
ncbi:MAG: four helix bundle protein [Patescibacteria group bacterium]